jgi:hypothetical protein
LRKIGKNEAGYKLSIDFKGACDSVRGEILYYIVIEVGIHINLVRLIKMCMIETCSRFRVRIDLSDMFPIKMVWNKETHYGYFFKALPYIIPLGGFR